MPDDIPPITILRVADLPQNRATPFHLKPDSTGNAEIAHELGILGIRKLDFKGTVQAEGKSDWQLTAQLGATVEQACVITLDPVITRIDQPVTRSFVANLSADLAEEIEMPEDDTTEALGAEIDLFRVMTEALALALPDYPRRDDATLDQSEFAAPGVTPMKDEDTKPFAGLAQLKDKLEKGD
ncbi:DUF177 domain-containing protein [uncultured Roseovarius sp.]|uniref:YceD family protein n=1 Tax=uncultured Roseovarius sp. TaxID=293344 RepID=UPI002606B0D7|nr:DUF177 domain-containing protein [uncultured Roseovarius sp.]